MSESVGVLAMAYGTPSSQDELEAYYTHIRHGSPPPPELHAELRDRYAAIGGRSPLLDITRAQVAALGDALRKAGHADVRLAVGFKHAAPFIEDGAAELAAARVSHAIGLVLAPHYSVGSIGEYAERARPAFPPACEFVQVRSWATAPGYVDFLTAAVRDALAGLGPAAARAEVVFTAHSLPLRILEGGDPYPDELRATAEAVASAAGLARWSLGWQSAGRTSDPWIGPDILEVLPRLVETGATGVVVCPCGFVADHLEVLYDLDIEASEAARELGLPFARTRSPNAELGETLAEVVAEHLPAEVSLP